MLSKISKHMNIIIIIMYYYVLLYVSIFMLSLDSV